MTRRARSNVPVVLVGDDEQEFINDWTEGVSYSEIGRKFDCHTETVHAIADRLGLEPRIKRVYTQGAPNVLKDEDGAWVRSPITGVMKWVPSAPSGKPNA